MLGEIGLTYDTKHKKFYIFKRFKIDPNYFGSCAQIRRATKVRPDTLTKIQLDTATNPDKLNELERHYIKLLGATTSPFFTTLLREAMVGILM